MVAGQCQSRAGVPDARSPGESRGKATTMTTLVEVSGCELDGQRAELLPVRATLSSLVNINNITAVNLAIAVNAASIGSVALAKAVQNIGYRY